MIEHGGLNDEQFEEQNARIRTLIDFWPDLLGLTHWDITWRSFRGDIPGDEDAAMACAPNWKYMKATIRFNCAETADMTDDLLTWCFVHELMHVFLHEVRALDDSHAHLEHEERVATMLATALIRVHDRQGSPLDDAVE